MPRLRGPSRSTLLAAYRLGKKMARQEPRLRPFMRDAVHFSQYDDFRLAHRSTLENCGPFQPWDKRLHQMAEKEAYRAGFNLDKSSRIWDDFYCYIFAPIKNAFWHGWEDVRQLQAHYKQKRTSMTQGVKAVAKAVDVFHVMDAAPILPESGTEELSEEDRWDAIAEKLFDDLEGDKNENLWDLPEARAQGSKAKLAQA